MPVELFQGILLSVGNIPHLGLVLSAFLVFASSWVDGLEFLEVLLELAVQRGIRPQVLASRYLRALQCGVLLPAEDFWNKVRPVFLHFGTSLYEQRLERLEFCDFQPLLLHLGAVLIWRSAEFWTRPSAHWYSSGTRRRYSLISGRGPALSDIHQVLVDKAAHSYNMCREIFDVYKNCLLPSERKCCPQVHQISRKIMKINAAKLI